MSLERVWRISKLTPNSFLFFKKNTGKIETNRAYKMKTYEFGVSLERVWRISKLTPNSFIFSKKSKTEKKTKKMKTYEFGSLEKESPNSLQTHFSFPEKE